MVNKKEVESLVLRLQQGDERALVRIYDLYSDSLYGLIFQIVKDDAIAKDVLQESFVKIWKKANSYLPNRGSFFTWMLNICRNRSIDELRKIERVRKGKSNLSDSSVYVNNGLNTNVDTIGLSEIVEGLPEKHRLIVEYIYFRGYTQKEVSEELGVPLGTVKTRVRSALNSLSKSFVIIILIWILKSI